jgi:hypothetical protein
MVAPLILKVLQDDVVELHSDNFEQRRTSFQFTAPGVGGADSVMAFNISVRNANGSINVSIKANGVEMQRYSFSNQPTLSIHEAFAGGINLRENATNIIEFEIVDTPNEETGIVRISDVVMWLTGHEPTL